jgi:6,7-dimethyl-8-ribityllumazine synthase
MNRKESKKVIKSNISKTKAQKLRVGIVVSEFNSDITEKLLEGVKKILITHGVKEVNIEVVWVPGGFEIPLACQKLAKSRKKYNALIAIGCVIRGDTDHYVYIANESIRGTMDVMLRYNIPISNCILTVNTPKQAKERCGKDNKGAEAALAALQMV